MDLHDLVVVRGGFQCLGRRDVANVTVRDTLTEPRHCVGTLGIELGKDRCVFRFDEPLTHSATLAITRVTTTM